MEHLFLFLLDDAMQVVLFWQYDIVPRQNNVLTVGYTSLCSEVADHHELADSSVLYEVAQQLNQLGSMFRCKSRIGLIEFDRHPVDEPSLNR